MLRNVLFLGVLALIGCSDDDSSSTPTTDSAVPDTGSKVDTGSVADTGSAADTTVSDTGSAVDSTVVDSGVDSGGVADTGYDDAISWDTAGACHSFGFGAPAATIVIVSSLPTMTGGTIPLGVYDAVAAKTTGTVTGTYRATWSFTDATTLQSIEQLTLTSPSTPVPRTLTWSTSGTNLTRTQTCGGTTAFTNEYTVRTEAGVTYLDVRQTSLMFTFKKR